MPAIGQDSLVDLLQILQVNQLLSHHSSSIQLALLEEFSRMIFDSSTLRTASILTVVCTLLLPPKCCVISWCINKYRRSVIISQRFSSQCNAPSPYLVHQKIIPFDSCFNFFCSNCMWMKFTVYTKPRIQRV